MAASTQQEAFLMAPWRGMVWRTTRLGVLAFASDGAWCCTKAPGDGGRAAVSSSFGTFAVINKKGRLLSFDEPFRVVLMKTIQGGEFDAREMESVLVEWWPGSGARSRRTIGTRGRPSCRSSPCCGSSCRCRASSLRGRRRWRSGRHAAGQLAC